MEKEKKTGSQKTGRQQAISQRTVGQKAGGHKAGRTARVIDTKDAGIKSGDTRKTEVKEPAATYLTTRILERALKKATRNLTERAMLVRGYIITTEKNWVVKKYKDGRVERIKRIQAAKSNKNSGRA